MDLESLKKREESLLDAHKKISEQIEGLLDHRIKIVGAIEENKYIQKQIEKGEVNNGDSSHKPTGN